jgi:hypothetical protein
VTFILFLSLILKSFFAIKENESKCVVAGCVLQVVFDTTFSWLFTSYRNTANGIIYNYENMDGENVYA